MAAEDPEGIAGVLAFSPLSRLLRTDEAEVASRLTVPLFVTYATTPEDERSDGGDDHRRRSGRSS